MRKISAILILIGLVLLPMIAAADDSAAQPTNIMGNQGSAQMPSGPMTVSADCQQFAQTLGGQVLSETNGVCTATKPMTINVTISGRSTQSPLVLAALFSYEGIDAQGNALNLGETVILPEEINPFIQSLQQGGITITALHNHWLFEDPRLMYIHWMSVESPMSFAQKVANASTLLK